MVEFKNEVVMEIIRDSTAIIPAVSDDLVLFGNYFDIRTLEEGGNR